MKQRTWTWWNLLQSVKDLQWWTRNGIATMFSWGTSSSSDNSFMIWGLKTSWISSVGVPWFWRFSDAMVVRERGTGGDSPVRPRGNPQPRGVLLSIYFGALLILVGWTKKGWRKQRKSGGKRDHESSVRPLVGMRWKLMISKLGSYLLQVRLLIY